jgi:hypothetical protein
MNEPLIVALFATALLSTGCDPKFLAMELTHTTTRKVIHHQAQPIFSLQGS